MKINTTLARQLFVELGFSNASNWDAAKLATKINQIADKIDPEQEMKTPEGTKLLKQVFEALEEGTKIEVADEPAAKPAAKKGKPAPAPEADEDEESEDEKPAKKSKKAPAADEDDEEEAPAKKAKGSQSEGKDRFGNRVASQAGQINAAMSKKLQTVAQIAEATGLSEARVRSHMQYLIGRELAEHVEDKGYRLIK